MKNQIVIALSVVAWAAASSAYAGGYGPAPHYSPIEGAPASQRGMSAETVSSEREHARAWPEENENNVLPEDPLTPRQPAASESAKK
ncbi:hypothetical protein PQR33_22490 [Paraburkholderia sediminicola]|uniref:hypothetical protein n=1 Tax=Paraburkholderia sediminicola TaxID=458836 RepID=UPI0038B73BEC